jgi:hypothetical protein
MRLGALVLGGCLGAVALVRPANAQWQEQDTQLEPVDASPSLAPAEPPLTDAALQRVGRPLVKLDRLQFPDNIPNAAAYVSHLKRVLHREAARADWGAGYGARIEYRFSVTALTLAHKGDVLTVTCVAVGKLPRGKTARSRISFGGDPGKQREVVKRVLEIVARGVITRLAELERMRRGASAG